MPDVAKTYAPRGPLQQVRLAAAEPFRCFRGGREKKSKLHALYLGDWDRRLCNGCYGRLLSIYEVKAGTEPEDKRADALARVLLELVDADTAARTLQARQVPGVESLGEEARRFIGTAEYVAEHLADQPGLEWSPAVIGLCKAVEAEVVRLVVEPWRRACDERDLAEDARDQHVGRVAKSSPARARHRRNSEPSPTRSGRSPRANVAKPASSAQDMPRSRGLVESVMGPRRRRACRRARRAPQPPQPRRTPRHARCQRLRRCRRQVLEDGGLLARLHRAVRGK
jgi:hypothetical protein